MNRYFVLAGALGLGCAVACGGTSSGDGAGGASGSAGEGTSAGAAGAPVAGAAGNAVGGGGEAGGAEPDAAGAAGEEAGGGGGIAGSSGSSGQGGSAGLGGGPPIDIGPQATSTKLDVLLVVDNSVSMADKQGVLSASLPAFLQRLVNPRCVDAQGFPVAQQPGSGSVACITGARELAPVKDLHVGVISTSLGSHGGSVCAPSQDPETHNDDRGELIPVLRTGVASYANSGFASFDITGTTGDSNVATVIEQAQAAVAAASDNGCGYEAPLEAMYRFLVDPEPPVSVEQVAGVSTPTGLNTALLAQRKAFLRPDSAVAIVLLSDENDCSIRDDGVGWFVGSTSQRMPRSTAACETSANDPCCRSCAASESAPPEGCSALAQDPVCKDNPPNSYLTWEARQDPLNLRCYKQRQRFGFDLLYPVERYSNALSNPKIATRAGQLVDNPLFAARDGKGPRSATLVRVSTIVGAPWQDLSTSASIAAGTNITYLDGASLDSAGRWPLLLGTPSSDLPPTDPFMNESILARTGTNPLTSSPIVAATSLNPLQSPINGHELKNTDLDDLQYACTFALKTPKICANSDSSCDCSPDKLGDLAWVIANNSPLCQPAAGGVAAGTQFFGKAYPGARELRLVQLLGARAVPGSICPKTFVDSTSADYAYGPAFSALTTRLAATLR